MPSLMSLSPALPPFPRCPYGKDLRTLSLSCSPVGQIMLCQEVCFPFYVNTFRQVRVSINVSLRSSNSAAYPDLSRIKLRRLKWTSPHSWYEGLNQPGTCWIHYVCSVIKILFIWLRWLRRGGWGDSSSNSLSQQILLITLLWMEFKVDIIDCQKYGGH